MPYARTYAYVVLRKKDGLLLRWQETTTGTGRETGYFTPVDLGSDDGPAVFVGRDSVNQAVKKSARYLFANAPISRACRFEDEYQIVRLEVPASVQTYLDRAHHSVSGISLSRRTAA